MVWYYAEGDRQKGPISDEEFQDLVNNGRINNETLVWKDGMDNWQPLENTREAGLAATSPALPRPPGDASFASPSASTPQISVPSNISLDPSGPSVARTGPDCAQCGRGPLGAHDGVQLGNLLLCRNCDGDLARHYQSAAPPSSYPAWPRSPDGANQHSTAQAGAAALPYAGILTRAAAKIVDNLIESAVLLIVLALTTDLESLTDAVQNFRESPEQFIIALRPFMLGALVFRVLYDSILVGTLGATLGKMTLGVRVIAGNGSPVRFSQAIIRAIAPVILQLPALMMPESIIAQVAQFIFLFGYLIAIFDRQKRTLYDHIANTRVVRTR